MVNRSHGVRFSKLVAANLLERIDGVLCKIVVENEEFTIKKGAYYCARRCGALVKLLLGSMELRIEKEYSARCAPLKRIFRDDDIRTNGFELPPDSLTRDKNGDVFRVSIGGHNYYRHVSGVRSYQCSYGYTFVSLDNDYEYYQLKSEHTSKCKASAAKRLDTPPPDEDEIDENALERVDGEVDGSIGTTDAGGAWDGRFTAAAKRRACGSRSPSIRMKSIA